MSSIRSNMTRSLPSWRESRKYENFSPHQGQPRRPRRLRSPRTSGRLRRHRLLSGSARQGSRTRLSNRMESSAAGRQQGSSVGMPRAVHRSQRRIIERRTTRHQLQTTPSKQCSPWPHATSTRRRSRTGFANGSRSERESARRSGLTAAAPDYSGFCPTQCQLRVRSSASSAWMYD